MALVAPHGRLYHLNPPARAIADALVDGEEPHVVAKLLASQADLDVGEAWCHVDALEGLLWPRKQAAERGRGVLSWRCHEHPPSSPIALRCYRLLGQNLVCRFGDRTSLDRADAAFAHLEQRRSSDGSVVLEIQGGGDHVEIRRGQDVLDEAVDPDSLVNTMRLVLAEASLTASDDEWAVHAAAVARGGRAVLLPGPAGRGKSTLALGLGVAGFTVLGDDTLALASETLEIRAMPFPLCIKHGAWHIADRLLGPAGRIAEGRRRDGVAVRWLTPSAGVDIAAPDALATPEHLIFPAFSPNARADLSRLGTDEALQRLVPALHPLGAGLTADKVERLISWAERLACFELRFPRLEEGVAAIRDLLP